MSGTIDTQMRKAIVDHFFEPASAHEPDIRVCKVRSEPYTSQKGKGCTNLMSHLTAANKGHPDELLFFVTVS